LKIWLGTHFSVPQLFLSDIAWELLMDPGFQELRHTIYGTGEEKKRFRQLLVNVVLATDIVDKELKDLRNNRWDKAFKGGDSGKPTALMTRDEVNRKATIILEHSEFCFVVLLVLKVMTHSQMRQRLTV
jgi:hypothetical protein